ncbi:cytochrome c biogenesis protein CcdC [Ornithinibacillus sp. BX22]|uniref:Cytochrome c biogenesis protein CcdC n=2 Tax=Ornithinibacillus TaxID=484508 RepID=A0A923L454_9BACI|nr:MULTISPECIES: cytochrome c biogenesis protein CcdC [Ornithinibacillus]MBC5636061.1 cytochrome c biogenesis protein CcdC [Ornithinibacillus hominis]MBS3679931.1 cytochrome c biogenesis protein CcdC [Ornithinibacillus massiliensis]
MFWIIASTVVAFVMASVMIVVRLKASRKPASVKRIILPPLFMSTGALMFLFPEFQIKWIQVLEALTVGVVFSIFLIKTSNFEIRNDRIYLIPSKAFIFILVGLLIARLILKIALGGTITLGETSGMFFLLAFGMLGSWRLAMLYKYKQLEKELKVPSSS